MNIEAHTFQTSDVIAFGALLISVIALLWQWYLVVFKNKVYVSMVSIGLNNSGLSGPHQFYLYITTNADVPYLVGSVLSSGYFQNSLPEIHHLSNKNPLFMVIDSDKLHEAMGLSRYISIKVKFVIYNRGIKFKAKRVKIRGFKP